MVKQVIKYEANGRLFDTEEQAKEELSWGKIRQRTENIDALCMEHLGDELSDDDFRNYFKEFIRQSYADLFPDRGVFEAEGYQFPSELVSKLLTQARKEGIVDYDIFMEDWNKYRADEEK